MICPKCGSNNVNTQVVTSTQTKTKGFGCIKSFLGFIFFSIPGLLCGLCGMGKGKSKTKSKKVSICQECGHQF
jgi:hypothetical protein